MSRAPLRLALVAFLVAAPLATAAADSFLDQARQAVQQAGKQVGDAAKKAGRSVRDFLTDNPDLNRDVVDFGSQVGVPGFDGAKPATGPVVLTSITQAAPGAPVTLQVAGFPGDAAIDIYGQPASGEASVLTHATTSSRGEAFVDIIVPPAPADGQNMIFYAETSDGRVTVKADLFNIVAAGAAVSVTGTLTKEGVECQAMRGDDGKLYTLTPAFSTFGPGDRVHVEGSVAEMTMCQQGTTLVVAKITAAK